MLLKLWKKVSRHGVYVFLFFLPYERKKSMERWLRGKEELRKLNLADWVLVSWAKSGRTWLRVMLSRAYQMKYGLSERSLLGFDNLHRKNPAAPTVFFTHGNYLKDYTGNRDSKIDFYDKKVVLLVRDPRDVAVSQFFQWKFRMRPRKKKLNDYPGHGEDVSTFDFVMNSAVGLPRIIDYFNGWAKDVPRMRNILVVRYEDMRKDPARILGQILEFVGTPCTNEQIKEAVEFAAYENMKKLEQRKAFWFSGDRLVPRDRKDPNTYKVRRAKVGGYRDYFDDQQIEQIDALVDSDLAPFYGYGARGNVERRRKRDHSAEGAGIRASSEETANGTNANADYSISLSTGT